MPQSPITNVYFSGCSFTLRRCEMLYAIPDLDAERLQKVQNVEKATGLKLLALDAVDVAPAKIEDEELNDIQALENELGITLVAVN